MRTFLIIIAIIAMPISAWNGGYFSHIITEAKEYVPLFDVLAGGLTGLAIALTVFIVVAYIYKDQPHDHD